MMFLGFGYEVSFCREAIQSAASREDRNSAPIIPADYFRRMVVISGRQPGGKSWFDGKASG
jgi:hypothetical protein